ncbi:hypothetical protein ACWEPL_43045 [Nonomuraea sp. NPDC004186]
MLVGTDTPASVVPSWTRHPELDTVLAGRSAEMSDVARLLHTGQV